MFRSCIAVTTKKPNGVSSMIAKIVAFVRDEDGATAIEYGLIAGLICVVIITTITMVGSNLESVFNYISSTLDGALLQN